MSSSTIRRLSQLASSRDKCLYCLGLICSIGSGTVLPLMTVIFGNFVSVFNDFALGRLTSQDFMGQTSHYTLYFIYLFIAKACLSYISMVLFTIVSTNVTSALQQNYLRAVIRQRIAFHETAIKSGTVVEALSRHSNSIRSGLADKFGMTIQHAATVVAGFVVATVSIWNLALAVAAVIPAVVIIIGATSLVDEKLEQRINTLKEDASTLAEEVFSSIRTVRSLGATEKLLKKYKSLLEDATRTGWRRSPVFGLQVGAYMFLMYCAYALAFWYGIRLFASGQVQQSGKVITTLFSTIIALNSFSQVASYLGAFSSILKSGRELIRIIDAPVDDVESFEGGTAVSSVSPDSQLFNQDIIFSGVSFQYPTRPTVSVLNAFTLTIPAGKRTAIVGSSGCGKSTIVSLLLRWYDISTGDILVGHTSLRSLPSKHLRANIGIVQQEPQLFSGTIFENVAFGLLETQYENASGQKTRQLIENACKMAHAHDFISQLPKGYDTLVGDRGTQLSGGQKQRISIARAIVKDPPILILDEATSALDTASEAAVQKAIDTASAGRTIITIAHRLSTIRNSDKIVVLADGAVVEEGTHESLHDLVDGLYRRLWEAQASQSSKLQTEESKGASPSIVPLEKLQTLGDVDPQRLESNSPSEETELHSLGVFASLYSILTRYHRYWFAFGGLVVCSIISGGLFPVQAVLYAKAVSSFELSGDALVHAGNFWALMWFVLALVVAVGYGGIGSLGMGLGEMVSNDFRGSYFAAFARQPIALFDQAQHAPSILLSRLSTDPDAIHGLAGGNLSVLVTVGTSLVGTVVLALAIGWKFALVVLAGGLPVIFLASYVRERMEHSFEDGAGKLFTECVGYAGECVQAIRTVSSLNMETYVERRFGGMLDAHCRRATHYALQAMVWFALSESVDLLCMALAFWYGGTLLASHEYSTEQFFIVFIAIVFGSQSMGSYFAHSSDIMKGVAAFNTIQNIVQSTEMGGGEKTVIETKSTLPHSTDVPVIEFRKVAFSYPERPEHTVLQSLNLQVLTGQFVAVVGESGSGKSTLVSLLERFYELNSGDLLINGTPSTNLSEEELQRVFSLVSQEPVLYQGTIRENILLGTSDSMSDDHIMALLKTCQLTDLVSSLPEGLNTLVGVRGASLSGGQRQRIALARALARQSPVLLLDEATSALDGESERLIQEAILGDRGIYSAHESQRRTVLAIAHRLSTVKNADVIYVLRAGRVVEKGSHDELVAARGVYWNMCRVSETGL